MGVRRVVTGHDSGGRAVFVSDEQVEPITVAMLPGHEFCRLWGSDSTCRFPDDGSLPSAVGYFPPTHGFRFGTFTVPPDGEAGPGGTDLDAALAEVDEKLPGLTDPLEPGGSGMHTTATVDLEFVVSGRVVLELDDGATRVLGPGDTVVQNGTRHAWRNPFDEPCTVVAVLVAAHHDAV